MLFRQVATWPQLIPFRSLIKHRLIKDAAMVCMVVLKGPCVDGLVSGVGLCTGKCGVLEEVLGGGAPCHHQPPHPPEAQSNGTA